MTWAPQLHDYFILLLVRLFTTFRLATFFLQGLWHAKKRTKKPLIKHPPPTRKLPEKVSPHKRTRHFLCQCWTPSPDEKTKNFFVLTYHYRGRWLVFAQLWFYVHESLSSKIFTRSSSVLNYNSRKFLLSYQTFLSRMFTRPEKSFQRKSRENFIRLQIDVITKKMKTSFS